MHYTIFIPNDAKLLETLKSNISKNQYPRALRFISELYIRHKQFDAEAAISRNEHKPKSIHSKRVRQILGRHYRATIDKLVSLGLIEFYSSYCAKHFSKGYRLTLNVLNVPFYKSAEVERIQINRERDNAVQDHPAVYQRILADAAMLTFDYGAAKKFIENDDTLNPVQKSWYLNFAIMAANDDFSPSICAQGRYHYKLTFCPQKLRQFFKLNGAKLVQIDIKACQIMLHTSLYPEQCEEKTYFDRVCSTGQFWKLMNATQKVPYNLDDPEQKKELKEKCFAQLFYTSKDFLYAGSRIVKGFKAHFPKLYDLMMEAKRKCRKEGRQMACEMQKLEVQIVIYGALAKIQADYPDNCFLTIHDCIECEDRMVDIVKKALTDAVVEKIGVTPGLDVKPVVVVDDLCKTEKQAPEAGAHPSNTPPLTDWSKYDAILSKKRHLDVFTDERFTEEKLRAAFVSTPRAASLETCALIPSAVENEETKLKSVQVAYDDNVEWVDLEDNEDPF